MSNTSMNSTYIVAEDNQAGLIALITLVNKIISQYGLGLIWLVGNIGSALTCVVFYQPAFRKSACAMYFIASNISQFFTFNLAVFIRMLEYGYEFYAINAFVWVCKIRYYLFYFFVANSHFNIIMASMDRYFASSRDALRRQWSSPKIALRSIIGNAIFWFLMYLQVIVLFEINNGKCGPRLGTWAMYFSIYLSIDSGVVPIFLMLLFGLLTIKNIHQTRRRIKATAPSDTDRSVQVNTMSRREMQLHKMLANQIGIYLILNIANPFYFIYRAFTVIALKSPFCVTVESFANDITFNLIYLGFALTFANFTVSSDMFRQEFRQLVQTKILHRFRQRITIVGEKPIRNGLTAK